MKASIFYDKIFKYVSFNFLFYLIKISIFYHNFWENFLEFFKNIKKRSFFILYSALHPHLPLNFLKKNCFIKENLVLTFSSKLNYIYSFSSLIFPKIISYKIYFQINPSIWFWKFNKLQQTNNIWIYFLDNLTLIIYTKIIKEVTSIKHIQICI